MEGNRRLTASRRHFLLQGGVLATGLVLLGPAPLLAAEKKKGSPQMEVTPTEDLVREHGVLRRLVLIFDEFDRRLQGSAEVSLGPLTHTAKLIRIFIQEYHEKDEEEAIFPRFEKAGKLTDLVKLLFVQHQAGRKLIANLEGQTTADSLKTPAGREKIRRLLADFNRMYRPHAAWEDTVLQPAFRSVITPKELDALGEQFEDKKQKLFGKDGFEKIVVEVAGIDKELGLYDLAQFTPKV